MSRRQTSDSPNSGSDRTTRQRSRSPPRAPERPQQLFNESSTYFSSSSGRGRGRGGSRQADSSATSSSPADDYGLAGSGLRYERPPPPVPQTDEEIMASLYRGGVAIHPRYVAESHRVPSYRAPGALAQAEAQSPSRSQAQPRSSPSGPSSSSSGRARTGTRDHATPPRSVPGMPSIRVQSGSSGERGSTSGRGSQGHSQSRSRDEAQRRGTSRRESRTALEDALTDQDRRRVTRSTSRRERESRQALIQGLQQSSGGGSTSSGNNRSSQHGSGSNRKGPSTGRGGVGKRR